MLQTRKLRDRPVVAFPHQIGCGLAQGNWRDYSDAIRKWAEELPQFQVVLVKLPGKRTNEFTPSSWFKCQKCGGYQDPPVVDAENSLFKLISDTSQGPRDVCSCGDNLKEWKILDTESGNVAVTKTKEGTK